MTVVHWLWHWMVWGAGYQITSGPIIVAGLWHHFNCEQDGCWRVGHRHPEHGRPVCRKHYHHDVVPERKESHAQEDPAVPQGHRT